MRSPYMYVTNLSFYFILNIENLPFLSSRLEPFLNILFGLTGEVCRYGGGVGVGVGLGCEPLRERDDHPSFFFLWHDLMHVLQPR